jgi:precorrin-2 dehydrogenase / sirohydrochlorin ferrochelatase
MLNGERFTALVVGGGNVAARKARQLLEGGFERVIVVAPLLCDEIEELWSSHGALSTVQREYRVDDLESHFVVIAATDDRALNSAIAAEARARGRLVNVVDMPTAGNFVTPSVHRSGDLTIAVSTGRVPAAAAAIRRELAARFDGRYGVAIGMLRQLRERLLGLGQRDDWTRASRELIGEEFCADVEQGRIEGRVGSWR